MNPVEPSPLEAKSLPLNPPHKKPSPLSTTLSLIYIPRFSNFHYALLSLLNPSKERDGCSGHVCSIFLTEGGGSFLQCGTKESCITDGTPTLSDSLTWLNEVKT